MFSLVPQGLSGELDMGCQYLTTQNARSCGIRLPSPFHAFDLYPKAMPFEHVHPTL